ncbi:rhodanese-like domain-containing protein [Chondrinema litorale]|uniref:rhodanese-like domain-containing protein n=1 Tax=Chondrinema litorale TaxID=2994555 RepID=UPI002543A161|nr:rhodanese-like domain-containing protein [Chondrinema litorale]UZR96704.1 rhodanese-like domain-containing protein [Chondrinema litorale]
MEDKKSKVHYSNEIIEQITSAQLDEVIAKGEFTIIDVRPPQGIESQGEIPTAINIPLDEVKKQIDQRKQKPESILNGEGPFLFACTGGVMSYMAAIHAQENGVKRVYNLEGGHSAWKKLKKSQEENQLI